MLVTAITNSAHTLLWRPNGGPAPWQRRNRKRVADPHANANVRLSGKIPVGTLRPLDAKPRLAKLPSGNIVGHRA
jgi:hypothetical protein